MVQSKQSNQQKQSKLFDLPPATEVMKTVAAKTAETANQKDLKKVFSSVEIDEIIAKRDAGTDLSPNETAALRIQYRKIKRLVKEMENGNNQKIIVLTIRTNILRRFIVLVSRISICLLSNFASLKIPRWRRP